ncbi:hypothetical protein J2T38_002337 [Neisseria perflava]|uniref:hypothetical protein n=1 Tax=Neisseria perflava TaxID=33053 RepID=UPI0020A05AC0|nr:hypothetical protein [Neisseria perflava]MCP1773483.1 hypothetical protein [Neisseria perflava]
MSYRVGLQCVTSQELAEDLIFSATLPTITQNGDVLRPEKSGSEWYLNGAEVSLSFPECSITEQISAGAQIGSSLLVLFVLIAGFKMIYRMVYSIDGVLMIIDFYFMLGFVAVLLIIYLLSGIVPK